MSGQALSDALQALAGFTVADATLGDTLQRVSAIAHEALPPAEAVGLSLLDDSGRPVTPIYTNELAPEIDQSQYDDDRGPCLDAFREERVVRLDDIEEAREHYPAFARSALGHGVKSSLSFPLQVRDRGVGAMNLYARPKAAFSKDDERTGADLAAAASVVLANANAYWQAYQLGEQLNEAMQSRAVIEQAKGMLMAKSAMSADEAFDVLRRASQRENVKLRTIAQRIVDRQKIVDSQNIVDRQSIADRHGMVDRPGMVDRQGSSQ